MKKLLLLVGIALCVYATDITISKGWNLIGATNDIAPSSINSAKTAWTFRDGNWTLYQRDNVYSDNLGFGKLDMIKTGEGFWINSDSSSVLHIEDRFQNQPIYQAYGLYLMDKKRDARYTVSNDLGANGVVFNQDQQTFELSAYKNPYNDSRAGISIVNLWTYPVVSVKAEVILKIDGVDQLGSKNRAQLNLCSLPITQDKNSSGCAGIILSTSGVVVWYERDYFNGQYVEIMGKQIGTENMVGKDVTMKISLDGSKITYSVSGDVNHEMTFDTADTNATTIGEARSCEIRARVKGNDVDPSQIADATHVSVKNVSVEYK